MICIPNDANQIVLPHWHPEDENIVVVKGTWYMGMGDKFDRSALREMNVGDYALVPKHMRHFAWSKTGTIIQVDGIGPFQVIPAVPVGGVAFNSAAFKNDALEINIDSPLGKFFFNGEYKEGALSGTWSSDNGLKGTWDEKKVIGNNR